jgi:hypothetical protein
MAEFRNRLGVPYTGRVMTGIHVADFVMWGCMQDDGENCSSKSKPLSKIEGKIHVRLLKIVSKETTLFGGGEHHTNGTRVDEEDRVPTNALARELRRTEHGR